MGFTSMIFLEKVFFPFSLTQKPQSFLALSCENVHIFPLTFFLKKNPTAFVWVSVRAELSTLFLQQPNRRSLLLSSFVSLSAALSSAVFVCHSPFPSAGPVLLLFSCKTLMVIGWTLLICISSFTENRWCHWTPAVLNELSIYFTTRMCSEHIQTCACLVCVFLYLSPTEY